MKQSRRAFLTNAAPVVGGAFGFSRLNIMGDDAASDGNKQKILVVGAHPDDPETMCGGTMALYSSKGNIVVSAYLTRGEAGIENKSYEESAKIRTGEANKACDILKARPEFLGQIDGNCEITKERYEQMIEFIRKEEPDIIITHWPIDTHRDHRICSVLVYDAWLTLGYKSVLFYGEVMTGVQSQNFSPTNYVDITGVVEQKHKACFVHVSQEIEETYGESHGKMEVFRGLESGFGYAEAFIRQVKSPRNKAQIL